MHVTLAHDGVVMTKCIFPSIIDKMDMDIDMDSDLEAQFEPDEIQAIMHLHACCRCLLLFLTIILMQIILIAGQVFFTTPHIPYHTSVLTGQAWVLELMNGHPNHIKTNLGVSMEVFSALVIVLNQNGIVDSRNGVLVEEQLAIYLYTCVTGLSSCLVGEWFQRSTDTVTK